MITSSKIEQRAAGVAEHAQRLEKSGRRRDAAHVSGDGLDDDRGKPLAVALDRRRDAVDVVVVDDDRVRRHAGRHAGRRRDAERREPGAGAGEKRIGVAVIAAGELDHPVAVGEAAREPERRHRRLGAGRDEPDLLDRRHRIDDLGRRARPRVSVVAPKVVPSSAASRTASIVSGSAWPKISGPHDCTQSSSRRPSVVSR